MGMSEAFTTNELVDEFKKCLTDMSYARAGWDYSMPPHQRAAERDLEQKAKARARAIWSENPASHDDLRAAFKQTQPLVTMSEIEA
ncbi:hypothetical protein ASD85_06420 [Rhizobium sp. Root651]|nr:hypothetical protein ASD85_06420 [Rhizobium sp. Root651]